MCQHQPSLLTSTALAPSGVGAFSLSYIIIMSTLRNTAALAFFCTSFLATTTILVGYGVANWQQAQYEKQFNGYELPTTPATGEYTAH